jgi:hypothetical protein
VDLLLFTRVIASHKLVVVGGILLAVSLSFLSFVQIDLHNPGNLQYRQKQQWASYSTLFVTQQGFPWGSLGNQTGTHTTDGGQAANSRSVDPVRLISLAVIYSQLIPSDAVLEVMRQSGPIDGTVEAAPVTDPANPSDVLPLISVAGLSDTQQHATDLVRRATSAFRAYLAAQQAASNIAPADRVVLSTVNRPGRTKLLADRSKTLPIVVFLTVALATIAICFILENLRPRIRAVTGDVMPDRVPDAPPRTA